jgi:FAD/FMN-containing dehydrogenase
MRNDLSSKLEGVRGRLDPAIVLGDSGHQSRYGTDWTGDYVGRPALVLRPRTTEEVVEVVRACGEAQLAIVPQGGHTGLVGSATPSPRADEVVVSLERMNR